MLINIIVEHVLGLLLKESYMAQNSLEFKLPSRSSPPFYVKQRILSPGRKKRDINFDYAQLPAGPASGRSPKCLYILTLFLSAAAR